MNEKQRTDIDGPARLLLHACCGPCSMEPVRLLQERGVAPVIFYANSNIHPAGEYDKRLTTLRDWAHGDDPDLHEAVEVVEGAYDARAWEATAGAIGDAALADARERVESGGEPAAYREAVAGGASPGAAVTLAVDPERRRARCRACYRLRFEEAARYAADHGFDTLGTTLSVSPYQYTDVIREELERAAAAHGLTAAFEDYRPHYDEATRRSRALGMYRQNNCGCRISVLEAEAERAQRKTQRKAAKAADALAHEAERREREAKLDAKRAEKAAYAEKQARKHAVLKAMREAERKPQEDSHDRD